MSLSKTELKQREAILDDLRDAQAKLEDGLSAYHATMTHELDKLNDLVVEYNMVLSQANSFRDDFVARLEEVIDERSEKWLESEKGEATVALKDEWEGLYLDEIETFTDQNDFSFESSHADDLEALSTEVE